MKFIYKDHLGFPTCGVGHLITKNDPEYDKPIGTPVTHARVMELLHADLSKVESEIHILFPDFSKYVWQCQHVLGDLCFNLGLPRLSKFKKMIAALEKDDIPVAAAELMDSKYAKQVPNQGKEKSEIIIIDWKHI